MAKLKVGINGFGRIGRVLFRAGFDKFDIVGINNLDSIEGSAHLLKYDSSHGIYDKDVKFDDKCITVAGKKIHMSATRNPAEIPWKEWGVDVVLECTGAFKKKDEFMLHIKGGAKRVMVSAPAEGADRTIVYGVNHTSYDPAKDHVLSNASCTTNCLAPIAKILNDTFGIESGLMTTIHSYTNDQRILDAPHKDLRRARSAAVSMIPTSTGAAKAIGLVIPELVGKLDGTSVRVPTPNVSLVDFTAVLKKDVTIESLNKSLIDAANGALKGILKCEDQQLVSIDFNGNTNSSIVDLEQTMVINNRHIKIMSWYDNEVGFSNRMVDLALYMAEKGL